MDSKLSSGLSSCHCTQDFVQIVWRFNFVATSILPTNCSEEWCYKAEVPGTIRLHQKLVWRCQVVCKRKKDQQVATVVQDRSIKLVGISSSP